LTNLFGVVAQMWLAIFPRSLHLYCKKIHVLTNTLKFSQQVFSAIAREVRGATPWLLCTSIKSIYQIYLMLRRKINGLTKNSKKKISLMKSSNNKKMLKRLHKDSRIRIPHQHVIPARSMKILLLPSDQGEGNEVDLFTTMIYDLYPEEDKPMET
jgi:hypothetical protein